MGKGSVSGRASIIRADHLTRRDLLRRAAIAGAGVAAVPLLSDPAARSAVAQDIPRAQSSAPVTDRLRVLMKNDFHPDHNVFMRAEIEAYAAANGWAVEVTDVAGVPGGDLNQALLGAVQAGNQADVLIHESSVRNMQTLGLLEPVTDLVTEMIAAYGDPIPGARFDATVDDEWLAIPFFTRTGGLWVRQDVFAEHGLDILEDTDTFDKLREAALAVSDPGQRMWGWGMTVNRSSDGGGVVRSVIYRHGGHLQDATGQIVTFDSPETVAALEWLKETYTAEQYAPMLPPGVLSWSDTSNNEALLAGQTAATFNGGTVYAKAFLDKVPFADQIALIPSPKRTTDGTRIDFLTGGMKFFVIKGAKNQEAAHDLTRHFLTRPVQERIWSISTGYALPAYEDGWDNPIITANENSMRAKEIALTQTGFTGLAWPGPENAATASIADGAAFTDMMAEVLQGRPVEEVVADYHQQFVQIYQDFGLQGE